MMKGPLRTPWNSPERDGMVGIIGKPLPEGANDCKGVALPAMTARVNSELSSGKRGGEHLYVSDARQGEGLADAESNGLKLAFASSAEARGKLGTE